MNPQRPEPQSGALPIELYPPRVNVNHGFERTMARPRGFEPLTYGLEVRCSIQLSYGRSSAVRDAVLVGARGFEPPTLGSQNQCANQTALRPGGRGMILPSVHQKSTFFLTSLFLRQSFVTVL